MRTQLQRLGNSQAVVIPKPLLAQLGIERGIEMEVVDDHIELRKAPDHPRAGWAGALSALPDDTFTLNNEDEAWLAMPGPVDGE